MVCVYHLGILAEGNNYDQNLFEAQADQDAINDMTTPIFDREYLYAVMTYLFPGMLTRLVRSALVRHQGEEQNVNNQIAPGQFREAILHANQGFAPGANNKALRNLQKAFGRVEAHNPVEVDRNTHRLDGHLKATKVYCCRVIIQAYNGS